MFNGNKVDSPLQYTDVYCSQMSEYQQNVYDSILAQTYEKFKNNDEKLEKFKAMESFGYNLLMKPLESLNMVYPQSSSGGEGSNKRNNGRSSNRRQVDTLSFSGSA